MSQFLAPHKLPYLIRTYMKKEKNPVWQFLSSVRLTLFTLFILATASIIGTIIPQNKPFQQYVQQYGEQMARLFQVLDLQDMYNSWWFLSLLLLLSLNLIVCTIERFPKIWRLVIMDNLDTETDRLEKLPQRKAFFSETSASEAVQGVQKILAEAGWQTQNRNKGAGGTLLFSQKGAWTRLGVIAVHISILVIFAGAIIGSAYGFKASVMIPEGSATDRVYKFNEEHTPVPLGFLVRCDNFDISFYDSGMPKEYRSELSVVKDGQVVYSKAIVVNDPMHYGGLTFYQSSYQGTQELLALVKNQQTGDQAEFSAPPRQEIKWAKEGVSFGVINVEGPDFQNRYRFKIWFSDEEGSPSEFWMQLGTTANIERPSGTYSFLLKERYATGLQVTKDPGVWYVYIGCGLMLLGLVVAFFMSHRRLWVYVTPGNSRTRILVSGVSNKNKLGFANSFDELTEKLESNESLNISKEGS